MQNYIETRESMVRAVFDLPSRTLERTILNREDLKGETLDPLVSELARLLGMGKVEAVSLLGVSLSRKSRNSRVSTDMLDRAYSALEVFARVASVLGEDAARAWFAQPKKALEGVRPLDLLHTRVGLARLNAVLTALEDGAYL